MVRGEGVCVCVCVCVRVCERERERERGREDGGVRDEGADGRHVQVVAWSRLAIQGSGLRV